MEKLIWNCQVCGNAILPEQGIEDTTETWMVQAVAIFQDGRIIKGEFNVLGLVGDEQIYDEKQKNPAVYHEFCYRNAGSPTKYPQSSEYSLMSEYNQGFFMNKLLNEMKREVYTNVSAKLEKTEDPEKLSQSNPRINGQGIQIETYNLLEHYVKEMCGFDFKFGSHEILLTQSEIARHFASITRQNVDKAERFNPELKNYYEEMERLYLNIAERFDQTAQEIKAIKDEINNQSELINSAPKTKMTHEHFAKNLIETVKEGGWSIMAVSDGIPFAYTIGLYKNFKHPEIVVMAINAQQSASLLNYLGEQVKEGKRFETGEIYEKDEESHRHVFLKVENKYRNDYFGKAIEFYSGLHFPIIQRVTADKQEIFPWEEGCDPVVKHAQKILGKVELKTS